MDDVSLQVSNAELASLREVQRSFLKVIERLDDGEVAKIVITTGNRMRAVLLTPEAYSELLSQAKPAAS